MSIFGLHGVLKQREEPFAPRPPYDPVYFGGTPLDLDVELPVTGIIFDLEEAL